MLHHKLRLSDIYKYFVIFGIIAIIVLNGLAILGLKHNMNKVTVELKGDTHLIANVNDDYNDPGVYVSKHGMEIKYNLKRNNNIDMSKLGTYTQEYEIEVEGQTYKLVREVEVKDTEAPKLKVVEVELQRDFCTKAASQEPTYTAMDNYDGDVTKKVEKKDNGSKYTLSVTDTSGNKAEVNIMIKDQEEPANKIVLNGYSTLTVYQGGTYKEEGAKVLTGCAIELPEEQVTTEGSADTNT